MNSTYHRVIQDILSEPLAQVIVFDGYSGLGYKNPDKIRESMQQEMLTKLQEMKNIADVLGEELPPLYVVAGATADGIGCCYDVAEILQKDGWNIKKVGIVSEAALKQEDWGKALPDEQASRLEHLVVVDDPNSTWQVLNDKGQSYMVDIAFAANKPAIFSFYGGGGVANSELKELASRLENPQKNIQIVIRHGTGDFAPKEDKAAKKFAQIMEKSLSKGLAPEEAKAKAQLEINGTGSYVEGASAQPTLLKSNTLQMGL